MLKVVRAPILRWENSRQRGFAYWWFRGSVRRGRLTTSYNCSVVAARLGRSAETCAEILGAVHPNEATRADGDEWLGEWSPIPEASELGGYAKRKITHRDFGYWWFRGDVKMGTHTIADYRDGLVVYVGPGGPHVRGVDFDRTVDEWVGLWCPIPSPSENR